MNLGVVQIDVIGGCEGANNRCDSKDQHKDSENHDWTPLGQNFDENFVSSPGALFVGTIELNQVVHAILEVICHLTKVWLCELDFSLSSCRSGGSLSRSSSMVVIICVFLNVFLMINLHLRGRRKIFYVWVEIFIVVVLVEVVGLLFVSTKIFLMEIFLMKLVVVVVVHRLVFLFFFEFFR